MAEFPDQTVSEIKKNGKEWQKGHFLYAEELLRSNRDRNGKFSRLYNAYNGLVSPKSIQYLTNTYGKANRAKYVSYRLSKTKIDLINNEWLMRPLNSTVTTVNVLAKTEKLEQYETGLGAAHAREPIEKLRSVGVDPLDGMEIPDLKDESSWKQLSPKDRNESVMQVLINSAITDMDLQEKLAKNFQDLEITAMCFGQNIVTVDGDDDYMRINPMNAIYVEVENDTYLKRSPLLGHLEQATLHDTLRKFSWTEQERLKLKELCKKIVDDGISNNAYRGRYNYVGGELTIDLIHVEWKSVRPTYYKISPLTKAQEDVNPPDEKYRIELDTEEYERNKEKYDKDVKAGKYLIEIKYQEELWEGWQVGHEIYKDVRRKPFTMRREDAPGDVYDYSYTGLVANTVNGYRVSLQELMDQLSNAFDVVMYQIFREIGKVKGKSIVYDSATLPRKTTIKDVLYQLANDNFININTSAAGNISNRDISNALGIKEVDLGLSQSFPSLVNISREIKLWLDEISGINDDRSGQTAASSTATNAQNNITNSRVITEGWFYLMSKYSEKIFMKIAQTRKLIFGLYKPEKGRIILGDEKFGWMMATRDLAYCDFAIRFIDGGRENDIRRKIFSFAEASLNTKELRYQDAIEFMMTETLADGIGVLKRAWKEIQAVAAQRQNQAEQAAAEQNQANNETQMQIAAEDREDRQKDEKDNIILKGEVQKDVDNNKTRGSMIADQNGIEQNNLFAET